MVCLLLPLQDADLLSTLFRGGFKKLSSCQAVKGGVSELPDSSLGCQNRVINVCPVKRKCYSSVWQLGCLKGLFGLNLGSSSRWKFFMTHVSYS